LLEKVYEAFDFTAPRFIQLVIRKPHLERVFDYRKARPPGVPPLKLKYSPALKRWAIVVGFAITGVQSKHVNEPFPKTKAASDSSVATVLWTVGNARSRLFFRGSQN